MLLSNINIFVMANNNIANKIFTDIIYFIYTTYFPTISKHWLLIHQGFICGIAIC